MALTLQAGEIFDRYEIVGRIKVRGTPPSIAHDMRP